MLFKSLRWKELIVLLPLIKNLVESTAAWKVVTLLDSNNDVGLVVEPAAHDPVNKLDVNALDTASFKTIL